MISDVDHSETVNRAYLIIGRVYYEITCFKRIYGYKIINPFLIAFRWKPQKYQVLLHQFFMVISHSMIEFLSSFFFIIFCVTDLKRKIQNE